MHGMKNLKFILPITYTEATEDVTLMVGAQALEV